MIMSIVFWKFFEFFSPFPVFSYIFASCNSKKLYFSVNLCYNKQASVCGRDDMAISRKQLWTREILWAFWRISARGRESYDGSHEYRGLYRRSPLNVPGLANIDGSLALIAKWKGDGSRNKWLIPEFVLTAKRRYLGLWKSKTNQ